jgi:O-antigen/teichoic acid export membrane protein
MNFSRNILIYGLGNGISRFIQVLLVPVFVRVFSAEQYGSYDLVYTIQSLALLIGMMQLESFIARFYNEGDTKSKVRLISSSILLLIIFSTSVTVVICVFSKFGAIKLGNINLYKSIIVSGLCIIPYNIFYFFTMLLRLDNKPTVFIKASIFQVLINISLSILFVLLFKLGLMGIFLAIFISNLLIALWLLIIYMNQLELKICSTVFLEMRKFCLPAMPAVIIGWFSNYANRFVIVYFLSNTEVGVFSAALKFGAFFVMIDMTLRMAWVPYFWAQFSNCNNTVIYQKKFKQITSGLLILIFVFVFFADPLYRIFTPIAYWEGCRVVEILGLNFFISTLIGIVSMGPDIVKKTKYLSLFSLSALIINVVLLFLLTPILGILGVSLALLISNIALLSISWIFSEKLYYVGYSYQHLIFRLVPVIILIIVFHNQNSCFLYRLLIFLPAMLIYLTLFERYNIQLIRKLINR